MGVGIRQNPPPQIRSAASSKEVTPLMCVSEDSMSFFDQVPRKNTLHYIDSKLEHF